MRLHKLCYRMQLVNQLTIARRRSNGRRKAPRRLPCPVSFVLNHADGIDIPSAMKMVIARHAHRERGSLLTVLFEPPPQLVAGNRRGDIDQRTPAFGEVFVTPR